LDLFLEVCAAVDFAHRHLIIHRDLKPSNILVDGEGHAKLLDFGAAKLLGPVPVDRTKQFLTPRYASPEQMRGLPAAVSMDVYALSVILYELLTGRWPFGDPADMASNLRRASQEVQPNPPTASREAAEARSTTESGLQKALTGDLRAILSKGLETDALRRYATVAELAADVARYRHGQPVLARPQTAGYRFRKWIARNPLQTAAAVLALGGILTGVFLREQQRWIAEKRFDELRSLARYQMFDLQDQMLFYGSPLQVRKLMAERSLQALNTLSSENSPSFALQADLTEGYIQLAELLGNPLRANLGENEQGRALLSRARQMNEMLQAMQGPSRVKQAIQAQLDIQEALFDFGTQRTNDKLARARRSLEAWEAAIDPQSLTQAELVRMASLYHVLSVSQSQATGAVDPFATGGQDLKNARRLVDMALTRNPKDHLAKFADLQVKAAEAQSSAASDPAIGRQRLLDLVMELDSMDTGDASSERVRFLKARVLDALGWIEGQSQLYEAALTHLHRAVEGWGQLADQNPAQVNLRYELAGALRDMAFVSGYAGDHAQAARYMEEALREYARVNAKTPNARYASTIAELRVRLGMELFQAGRVDEGKAAIRQGQDEFVRLAAAPDAGLRVWSSAARYLVEAPSPDLVRAADALALAPKIEKAGGEDAIAIETLIAVYANNGMRPEAEAMFERYTKLVPQTNENARREAQKVQGDMQTVLSRLGK
ncbi:MAG: serine/threonine protein kinase, partial [Acidobacteria bacterium]|nr:serine/threonine protein kinase [Acidobacteriota bacterium]